MHRKKRFFLPVDFNFITFFADGVYCEVILRVGAKAQQLNTLATRVWSLGHSQYKIQHTHKLSSDLCVNIYIMNEASKQENN